MLDAASKELARAGMRFVSRMVQSEEPHAVVEAFALYTEQLHKCVDGGRRAAASRLAEAGARKSAADPCRTLPSAPGFNCHSFILNGGLQLAQHKAVLDPTEPAVRLLLERVQLFYQLLTALPKYVCHGMGVGCPRAPSLARLSSVLCPQRPSLWLRFSARQLLRTAEVAVSAMALSTPAATVHFAPRRLPLKAA